MKIKIQDSIAVEWSPSQRCFHVQTVAEMFRDNRQVFLGKEMTDYLCIGIFESEEEARKFLDGLYSYLKKCAPKSAEPGA